MKLEDFLALLEGVRDLKGHYAARCPAHEDKSPSLSIKAGEKWILTNCHAGCTTEDICSAVGIRVADLAFGQPVHPTGKFQRYDDDLDSASFYVRLSGKLSVLEHAKMTQRAVKLLRTPSASPPRKLHA